ncbi:MAG: DUF4252 domain-containing protein [Prevotella sp.]|jgi:hypothetical protein
MKLQRHILFLLLLLCSITAAHAQEALFRKYINYKGVSTVYISKQMLSMMDNQEVGDYDIGKLAKKLEEVRILSCEKRPLNKEIRNYAISWLKYNKYTLAMDIKDEDDNTQIFMKSLGKGRYEYSLVNYESDETDIIYIVGRVTLKDIKSLTD